MNNILNIKLIVGTNPFGRYKTDSDTSAELFRDGIVIPELTKASPITVDFGGANCSYPYIEEIFGGLLRNPKVTYSMIKSNLTITGDAYDVETAWKYINEQNNRNVEKLLSPEH